MNYWENRYQSGGTSGKGSVGENRVWKWSIVDRFVSNLSNVIDVGCGDLLFWEGRDCEVYFGIDSSKTIIEKNSLKRPEWNFIYADSTKYQNYLSSKVVFCFDLLFHLLPELDFILAIFNLCHYSEDLIFVNSWVLNPLLTWKIRRKYLLNRQFKLFISSLRGKLTSDKKYHKFRLLEDYFYLFRTQGFQLINIFPSPADNFNALYVFRKVT